MRKTTIPRKRAKAPPRIKCIQHWRPACLDHALQRPCLVEADGPVICVGDLESAKRAALHGPASSPSKKSLCYTRAETFEASECSDTRSPENRTDATLRFQRAVPRNSSPSRSVSLPSLTQREIVSSFTCRSRFPMSDSLVPIDGRENSDHRWGESGPGPGPCQLGSACDNRLSAPGCPG
jgi:hypothetical protein